MAIGDLGVDAPKKVEIKRQFHCGTANVSDPALGYARSDTKTAIVFNSRVMMLYGQMQSHVDAEQWCGM
ncbi:hypothetical protein PG984_013691 [Apiospora sp. TS-2023a]